MAFTYDIAASGEYLTISQIRLEIGDTVEDSGVRPDGRNFSDAELLSIYGDEGDHVGRAAARCCELLAREWGRVPKTTLRGDAIDPSQASVNFAREARELRRAHGSAGVSSFAVELTRAYEE